MGIDGVEHKDADGSEDDKVWLDVDEGEDEKVDESMEDVESEDANVFGMKGGEILMLI